MISRLEDRVNQRNPTTQLEK